MFIPHHYPNPDCDACLNAGRGLRNIARTIRNRINRLARNAILIHEELLSHLPFGEDFAADGFESFCVMLRWRVWRGAGGHD